MSSTINSIITNRDRDCLACRIVSGGGLIGSGLYVLYHSKKLQKPKGKAVLYTITGGMCINYRINISFFASSILSINSCTYFKLS